MSELATSERLEEGERLVSQATQTVHVEGSEGGERGDLQEREGEESTQVQISASLSEVNRCLLICEMLIHIHCVQVLALRTHKA